MTQPPEDPYLPGRPEGGLSVDRYELELDYRVATNRLDARAVVHARASRAAGPVLAVPARAPGQRRCWSAGSGPSGGRSTTAGSPSASAGRCSRAPACSSRCATAGSRGPHADRGARSAGRSWRTGSSWPVSPTARPRGSRATTAPRTRRAFSVVVTAEAGYEVLANGRLVSRTPRAGRVRWAYEQAEPMAPYLATVQIGRYQRLLHGTQLLVPPRLLAAAEHDLARQPADDGALRGAVRALPVRRRVHGRRHRRRPRDPAGGAGPVRVRRQPHGRAARVGAAGGARARAPVVRQQPDRRAVAGHLAARGLRLLRRVVVVGAVRRLDGPPPGALGARATVPAAAGPGHRRPRRGGDVRRPALQARSAHPARPAADRGRRRLLRHPADLGRAVPARDRQHRAVRRVRVRGGRRPARAPRRVAGCTGPPCPSSRDHPAWSRG